MSGFFKSSIGRKVSMALSALFLMVFLLQHLTINLMSVFNEDLFNEVSQFMGTNPVVQFILQPILIFGVVFHFVMGFILEIKNNNARNISYAKNNGAANSTWMSRNMIWSGGFILIFLIIHMIDFWVHEMNVKYVAGDLSGLVDASNLESGFRFHEELVEKFVPLWRVALYCVGFVFLSLHLMHGFTSAFQSVGASALRKKLGALGKAYALLIPLGFIFVALFHHLTHNH